MRGILASAFGCHQSCKMRWPQKTVWRWWQQWRSVLRRWRRRRLERCSPGWTLQFPTRSTTSLQRRSLPHWCIFRFAFHAKRRKELTLLLGSQMLHANPWARSKGVSGQCIALVSQPVLDSQNLDSVCYDFRFCMRYSIFHAFLGRCYCWGSFWGWSLLHHNGTHCLHFAFQ